MLGGVKIMQKTNGNISCQGQSFFPTTQNMKYGNALIVVLKSAEWSLL